MKTESMWEIGCIKANDDMSLRLIKIRMMKANKTYVKKLLLEELLKFACGDIAVCLIRPQLSKYLGQSYLLICRSATLIRKYDFNRAFGF